MIFSIITTMMLKTKIDISVVKLKKKLMIFFR